MLEDRLLRELEGIVGPAHLLVQPEDVLVYEQDGYVLSRSLPDAVVLPGSTEEVRAVVRVAREHGVPVVPRGAGTGLAGGAIPVGGGIVLVLTRMNHILEIDPRGRLAVVEAGVINADLNAAVAPYDLFFAPDPGSQAASTIGGNIANNAGGPHCLAYGVTTNHVLGVEVVLADGSVVWLGGKTLESPGYDLTGLLVGSEGTLGIVTKAVVRLMRKAEGARTLLAIFPGVDQASQAVSDTIAAGIIPTAMEMLDAMTLRIVEEAVHAGYPLDAGAVLLIEVEATLEILDRLIGQIEGFCRSNGAREIRTATNEGERALLWKGRKEAFGALGRYMSSLYLADTVVPRHALPEVMREIAGIGERYGIPIANFFHAGDGNLHPTLLFDGRSPEAWERVVAAGEEIMRVCIEAGGTITGEHGVGIEKQEYMSWMYSEADLQAMKKVKEAFDPHGLLNPGKIFPTGKKAAHLLQKTTTGIRPVSGELWT
ncbi:MAG: FAD-linked oxidase C-terminal domain-containing protein [Armatimonadota bacterium]|nr:FAD-linked oxidase C-terminal domain-containing protein [Armatimonadota bacterium]